MQRKMKWQFAALLIYINKGERKMFEKFANFVVKFRYYLFGIFMALVVASVFMIPNVGINYDFTKYLPNDSSTKVALKVMEDEFGASGTASIMVENITAEAATKLAQDIVSDVKGVATISFDADDTSCYKQDEGKETGKALLSVFFEKGDYSAETKDAIASLREYLDGYDFALGGSAVETSSNQDAIGKELGIILLIAIAIVILVLFLTSRSWLEPLVYLIVIGCSIVINMGTNLVMGEISFVTQSISSIMLIALVMDYCIVLCHRYREESEKGVDAKTAMTKALSGSFLAIVASSLTVIAGLVALMFMEFTIGFDIGMVLAKGVFIGVLAVLFFMPSIIMMLAKGIEKTRHRSFMPKMDKVGTFAKKTRFIMPVLFLCIVAVGVYFQSNVNFTYVVESGSKGSAVAIDQAKIEATFGKQNTLVVMTKQNSNKDEEVAAEQALYAYIENYFSDTEKFDKNYVTSGKGLAASKLYKTKLTKAQILTKFEISDDETIAKIDELFESFGKNPATDSLFLADIVTALHNTPAIITSAVNNNINAQYSAIAANNLYVELNATAAQQIYQLSSQDAMNDVFKAILGVDTLAEDATVKNYKVLAYLYEHNIENRAQVDAVKNAYESAAFETLTTTAIAEEYGLTSEQIADIFAFYGKDATAENATIYALEFAEYAKNNAAVPARIAAVKQATIDGYYAALATAQNSLVGANYNRMLFNLDLEVADEKALDFIRDLSEYLSAHFESAYIVSNSENVINTMDVFSTDRLKTDLITVLLIFFIVLLTFRSLSIPIVLVLAIQGAIWINLGISSIAGDSVYFICYLLAMAIQMGATIDYAILLTDRYITARHKQNKFEAIKTAIGKSFTIVITSGTILIFAAFTIGWVSTVPLLKSIGILVGRGALLSVITILFVLPQCLLIFDKIIEKTTLKAKFAPLAAGTANNTTVVETNGQVVENVNNDTTASENDEIKDSSNEVDAEETTKTEEVVESTEETPKQTTAVKKSATKQTTKKAEAKKATAKKTTSKQTEDNKAENKKVSEKPASKTKTTSTKSATKNASKKTTKK